MTLMPNIALAAMLLIILIALSLLQLRYYCQSKNHAIRSLQQHIIVILSYCPVLVDLDPKQFEVVNTVCSFNNGCLKKGNQEWIQFVRKVLGKERPEVSLVPRPRGGSLGMRLSPRRLQQQLYQVAKSFAMINNFIITSSFTPFSYFPPHLPAWVVRYLQLSSRCRGLRSTTPPFVY